LKRRGETIAEVWFKPEGEPFGLAFRIPVGSFQVPGLGQHLTMEKLLKAVGIAAEEVESWRHEGAPGAGVGEPDSELGRPLAPPPQGATHLNLSVRLKSPPPAVAPDESLGAEAVEAPEVPEARWQHLESRWHAILGLEASMDTMRMSMEALRGEMESSARRSLSADEKLHALNADVAQWNKAKSRVHYALPKVKEFIHRSIWATGSPERKKLGELFKTHVADRVPFPEMDRMAEQLEYLLKDRQTLSAQGVAVYQECKGVCAAVQGALRTLQSNAAARATQKRGETNARGKFF
jgi:hypothetical protein